MPTSSKQVIYEGERGKPHRTLVVDGVSLVPGRPTNISDALYEEIVQGSDRLKGHRFSLPDDDPTTSGDAE